jgi:hypothetical protein
MEKISISIANAMLGIMETLLNKQVSKDSQNWQYANQKPIGMLPAETGW